jgi:hypothetical protein
MSKIEEEVKQAVNKEKILMAYIEEPDDKNSERFKTLNKWKVILYMGNDEQEKPIEITIYKQSEKQCIDLIDSLNLFYV